MHAEQIVKNKNIGSINQDQINEYKKKVLENSTQNKKYRYSIMYVYTIN